MNQDTSAKLLSPLQLRSLTLKNRIMILPMCMYSARDSLADDLHLVHLSRFAMGGVGPGLRRGSCRERAGTHHPWLRRLVER